MFDGAGLEAGMEKGAGKLPAPFPIQTPEVRPESLQRLDADGFQTLLALLDLHADALVFSQRTDARTLDGGDVDENVLAAVVRSDEAEALGGVEPLDGAFDLFGGAAAGATVVAVTAAAVAATVVATAVTAAAVAAAIIAVAATVVAAA